MAREAVNSPAPEIGVAAANPPNGINVDVAMNDTEGAPPNGHSVIIYDAHHNPVGGDFPAGAWAFV